jgi:hypothetical protein
MLISFKDEIIRIIFGDFSEKPRRLSLLPATLYLVVVVGSREAGGKGAPLRRHLHPCLSGWINSAYICTKVLTCGVSGLSWTHVPGVIAWGVHRP